MIRTMGLILKFVRGWSIGSPWKMQLIWKSMPLVKEIREAVWACDSSKALSFDSYNLNFVKRIWHVIGRKFTKLILHFIEIG